MISPCIECSDCTLFPDGAMRCDIDLHLAINGCSNIKPGHLKIFEPGMKTKVQKVIRNKQEPLKMKERTRDGSTKRKVSQKQGKLF